MQQPMFYPRYMQESMMRQPQAPPMMMPEPIEKPVLEVYGSPWIRLIIESNQQTNIQLSQNMP